MHYFDPTLDWPRELLEEPLPDLVIVRSSSLDHADAPWKGADEAWTTDWVQFAAADGEQHFITMTFFDGERLSTNDRKETTAYLEKLAKVEDAVDRYRSLPSISNIKALSRSSVIICRRLDINSDQQGHSQGWSTTYELVGSAGRLARPNLTWQKLVVEPKATASEPGLSNLAERGGYQTPPASGKVSTTASESSTEAEMSQLTMYIVAASSDLKQDPVAKPGAGT